MNGERRPQTLSGYFNDIDKLAAAAASISHAKGIYFIPNPVDPKLLARAANRIRLMGTEPSTGDRDVVGRHWLLIDCDPVRPAGISASDAEHLAARQRAVQICTDLQARGWPWPILADSGNGAHLLYRIELPADDGGIVQRCLEALAASHDDAAVSIDRTVFNPARIWKLYGTWARKGDSTPDRPHRLAGIIKSPPVVELVSRELLEALAAEAPTATNNITTMTTASARRGAINESADTLKTYLAEHGVTVATVKERKGGGHLLILDGCPMNADHGKITDTAVVLLPDGKVGFECKHNGCAGYQWADVRLKIDPDRRQRATKPTASAPKDCGPVLVCLADVEPREIQWLWPGRVPLGRITLLVGRPGEGKSFLTTDMAARVSTGTAWPDGSQCPSGSVILICAEDDPGDTIRPRLDAHGADVHRVHLLSAVRRVNDDGELYEMLFTLADVSALEVALRDRPDCKLIVVDPIGSFLGGGTDAHRDNEVRGVLAPVAKLAEKYGPAVVVVAHRRKSTGSIADDLALGSRAFTGIARAVWHLTRDIEDKTRRLLLPGKNNLAPEGTGLAFRILGEPAAIAWEPEPVTMTADDALAVENGGDTAMGAADEAVGWLRDILADGPVSAKDVKRRANADGIAPRTLDRAKAKLGVAAAPDGYRGPWVWRLPDPATVRQSTPDLPENAKGETLAHSASSGALCTGDGRVRGLI